MPKAKAPTAFVSYAHYEGDLNNRPQVAHLSEHLRANGVDCHIDQYEENEPPAAWPLWMDQQIASADFGLLFCTPTYRRRFEGNESPGKGQGATWEGGAITAEIYNKSGGKHKFIPVTPGPRDLHLTSIPTHLSTTTSYDVTSESDFDRLLRRLHTSPEITKPKLGKKPAFGEAAAVLRYTLSDTLLTSKGLISDHSRRMATTDYYQGLVSTAINGIEELGLAVNAPEPSTEAFRSRVEAFESTVEHLAVALSVIAYYGDADQLKILNEVLRAYLRS